MEKKVFKFFTVDNFEKEEAYLRKMAQKGWHFKRYQGFRYYFEKGEPQDVYYRIDCHSPGDGDRDDYIQFFEDSGWSPVFFYPIFDVEWTYFRKSSNHSGITEIYTDSTSKISLFRKIRKRWSFLGIFIFTCMIILSLLSGITLERPFLLLFLAIVVGSFILLYSKMIFNFTRKIQKLQQ
ncbi:DUF2812 domain-containing protein [Gracilibacillus timonensis]|uniref:DUF2812 domain-containing protein n=1 Tax=Gracilibacillus timonensis TaxID=1816696 RepID=UPI0008241136|nr:DUF2812 domain-containing protein [Gracilibacillus timonensis]